MTPDPVTPRPTRKWHSRVPFVLTLLVVFALFTLLYVPSFVSARINPRVAIDFILARPESRKDKAASMVRISEGAFGQSFNIPAERLALGMVTTRDDHRAIIVYYIAPEGSGQEAHSIQLIDTQARTATWLMLDPAKMNDYFAAVASQSEGLQRK